MPTALITGASSGLGVEFARQLARERYSLVLTARREDRLKGVAEEAKRLGAPDARVIASDLSSSNAARALHQKLVEENVAVDFLVNNAGFGTHGRFTNLPLERELEEIELNIASIVALTHLFLPAMVERRRGTIINVASTAAFQPVPFMATYAATKAFVLNFSEALAYEVRASGVTVTALCPGPTRTEFQAVAGTQQAKMPSSAYMDAATVVAQAIASAKSGAPVRINGALNWLMAQSTRLAPRALVVRIAAAMFPE